MSENRADHGWRGLASCPTLVYEDHGKTGTVRRQDRLALSFVPEIMTGAADGTRKNQKNFDNFPHHETCPKIWPGQRGKILKWPILAPINEILNNIYNYEYIFNLFH